MSRYIRNISTQKDPSETARIVEAFMAREGFSRVRQRGEEVWRRGLGLMTGPQFIKADIAPGAVRLEAWISWAVLPGVFVGEMGLDGMTGAIPKSRLKARVAELERILGHN